MTEIEILKAKIIELEEENVGLKNRIKNIFPKGKTVDVPAHFKEIFDQAEETVGKYFEEFSTNPSKGRIEINGERYVLLRASSLSVGFLNKIKDLYSDKGEVESFRIGRNFLFDIAHVLGIEDAKEFHNSMDLKDSVSKLSAGPVHFAYTGWAFVDILPESNPTPDENFFLKYNHPYSFEADSWLKSGVKSKEPVCIMNSGYSSGWCQESFGITLTSVEISCRAKGDDSCTFIMAPPHKIEEYINSEESISSSDDYEVPLFFQRKVAEKKIKESLNDKELLLKEIHHRVKNNLQIISSLLNLQSNFITDNNSKVLFKETQNRIKTLALVHEKLYKSEDIGNVNLEEYIISITELLSYSFDKEYIDLNLNFTLDSPEKFDLETAIPCGLITNEILSNTYKYAFENKLSGEINIEFSRVDDNFRFVLEDNGIGIPGGVDVNNSKTLGLELIHALVEQLDGTVEVSSISGTKYVITFPSA